MPQQEWAQALRKLFFGQAHASHTIVLERHHLAHNETPARSRFAGMNSTANVTEACHLLAAEAYQESHWPSYLLNIGWRTAFTRSLHKRSPINKSNPLSRQSLAVVLRGEFRLRATRCADSIRMQLLQPAAAAGVEADVFLVTYEGDRKAGGGINVALLRAVQESYGDWLAHVALVPANGSTQLSSVAAALRVALHSRRRDIYDAVLVTRHDLIFKSNLHALLVNARLLGPRTVSTGFRFLWREAFADVRSRGLDALFRKANWREDRTTSVAARVGDAVHAFSFDLLHCFLGTLWEERELGLGIGRLGMHAFSPIVHEYVSAALTSAGGKAETSTFGFLFEEGAYDSSPCHNKGTTCRPNPIYASASVMSREGPLIDDGICMSPDTDFETDLLSNTRCCPSPDSCCPISVASCTDRAARLFEASAVVGHGKSTMPAPWVADLVERRVRLCAVRQGNDAPQQQRRLTAPRQHSCQLALSNTTFGAVLALCDQMRAAGHLCPLSWCGGSSTSGWSTEATECRDPAAWPHECGARWRTFCSGE